MKRTIQVFLGQTPRHVGTLRYDVDGARESASFEYSSAWLAAGDRFAIDPNLALVPGPQFHKKARGGSVFSAAIADTEPDGWGRRVILRDRAKRRSKGGPPNALELLLAVDDASRLGALRFQDEDAVFQRAPTPGGRAIPAARRAHSAPPRHARGRGAHRDRARSRVPPRPGDLPRRPEAQVRRRR